MAFKSQLKQSKQSTRRGSKASIVVSQSFKPSTKSEEFSLRLSSSLISKMGLTMDSRVDVLFDEEANLWMIQSSNQDGFSIAGKEGAPTGLVRYTLKDGHARITTERDSLPVKLECDESSLQIESGTVVFALIDDRENV